MHALGPRATLPHQTFAGCRALVADQHISVRNWLREQLSMLGIVSVSMASSAVDLVRHLKNSPMPFDVVLCDHHLDPARDGLQLLEELRYDKALPFKTIFMIVTAERLYPRVVAAAEFAPDEYLIKPFAPALLEDRLHMAIGRKRHLHVAHELLDAGDREAALAACDKLLAASSHYRLDVLRLKAEILVSLDRVAEAADIYQAVSSTRLVPWARMGYALTLHRQGRGSEAEEIALELNASHPEFISVYDFLAQSREAAGDLGGAADYLERAATVANSVDRLRRLAEIADAQGDHGRARSTLSKVLERTRKSAMLQVGDYVKLMRATLATGDTVEAKKLSVDMRRDLRGQDTAEVKVALSVTEALAARHADQMDAAQAHVDTALALQSDAAEAVGDVVTIELASACVAVDRVEAAAALAEQVASRSGEAGPGSRVGSALGALAARIAQRKQGLATPPAEPAAPPAGPATPSAEPATTAEAVALPADLVDAGKAESLLAEVDAALSALDAQWDTEAAFSCRKLLVQVFQSAPRDRRGIEAHIRYNKIAATHGGARHKPGAVAEP